MKTCFKCKESKPLTEFYRNSGMADGHLNKCKVCSRQDQHGYYRNNIEHYKQYERNRATLQHRVKARQNYAKTENGRAAGRKAKDKWRNSNPIKKGASTMVGNAVRDGRIVKPNNCDQCGEAASRIHGHHDDYSKPLEVRWLCPKCHISWHRENGEGLNA